MNFLQINIIFNKMLDNVRNVDISLSVSALNKREIIDKKA